METVILYRDCAAETAWLDNLFVIASFPRSGSHWTRRMMGEITVLRGRHKSAAYGRALNRVAGFIPPAINSPDIDHWETPFFVATHCLEKHDPKHVRVYLRRPFEQVFASTQKAMRELGDCWWGGTKAEVYEKWSLHVSKGCQIADVVIDYEMTRSNPATTVRTIGRLANLTLTDAEIAAAVAAGDRQNMLREQEACRFRQWDIVNREDKSNVPPKHKKVTQ